MGTTAKKSSEEVSNAEILDHVKEIISAIHSFSNDVDKRFEAMDKKMDRRFQTVEHRIEAFEMKTSAQFSNLRMDVIETKEQVNQVEKQMDTMQGSLDTIAKRTQTMQEEQHVLLGLYEKHDKEINMLRLKINVA